MENISIRPYRRAAVPLLAVQTADPADVLRVALADAQNGKTLPVCQWDCISGLEPANAEAQALCAALNNNMDPAIATSNPVEFLRALSYFGDPDVDPAVVVAVGMADIMADQTSGIAVRQAVWRLRDILSRSGTLLVLTVPMGWVNPYPDDIAVLIQPLPTADEQVASARRLYTDAGIEAPIADPDKVGDALTGLSTFAAVQATALSLTKTGLDLESLRARKRQQISETPGLAVYTGQERFADLGGLHNAKRLFTAVVNGRRKPGGIVFVDEIEKAMAGSGDTSGVSQSILGYLLSYMQDQQATGSIFIGPPGAAKSALGKAIGAEGDIPTIALDLGGIKGSLVGESEGRMRRALAVITAVTGGRPMFVATCNSISVLPPELRRRFTLGTMFFDLPPAEERDVIWRLYLAKYDLPDQELPESDGWTGAEIKQCCDLADRLGMTIIQSSGFVVPVSTSAREPIQRLRQEASGRYLSASYQGVYVYSPNNTIKRKMEV